MSSPHFISYGYGSSISETMNIVENGMARLGIKPSVVPQAMRGLEKFKVSQRQNDTARRYNTETREAIIADLRSGIWPLQISKARKINVHYIQRQARLNGICFKPRGAKAA